MGKIKLQIWGFFNCKIQLKKKYLKSIIPLNKKQKLTRQKN